MSVRFTAWLTEPERKGLQLLANEHGVSENFVIRQALRTLLGMPYAVLRDNIPTEQADKTR